MARTKFSCGAEATIGLLPPWRKLISDIPVETDPRYIQLGEQNIPLTEFLKDTVERFLPYWYTTIVPALNEGKKAIIVPHGNSLRALVKHFDHVSDVVDEIIFRTNHSRNRLLLEWIRSFFIGRLLIGNGFTWTDFPYYIAGSVIDFFWIRLCKKNSALLSGWFK